MFFVGLWLQSRTCGCGVSPHEAGVPQDHRQTAGKRRCDRLSPAAIIQTGRDHAGGSQSAGAGIGAEVYKRQERIYRRHPYGQTPLS